MIGLPMKALAAILVVAVAAQPALAASNPCHIVGTQTCCPTSGGTGGWPGFDKGIGPLYRVSYGAALLEALTSLQSANPAAYTALVTKFSQASDQPAIFDGLGLQVTDGTVSKVPDFEDNMKKLQTEFDAQNLDLMSVYASVMSANARGDVQLSPSQLDAIAKQLTSINTMQLTAPN